MAYEDLRLAIADGVAELTLDRPADRNAFSGPCGSPSSRPSTATPSASG